LSIDIADDNNAVALTLHKKQIEWRRSKVHELLIKGYNQYDIADALQISQPTISRDVHFLSLKAKEEIRHHIEDRLPFEYLLVSLIV
jgi:DNA-binding NarL/FixJ family response regulator